MKDTIQTIHDRTSVNIYETGKPISDNGILEILLDSTEAPSSFNMQHSRFLVITDATLKEKVKAVAYGQEKVVHSSATIVFIGDTQAHEELAMALSPSIRQGIIDQKTADGWIQMANGMYGNNPQLRRDEAIRSASLSAMTFMLSAQTRGYSTGPMIGFDPAGLCKTLGIGERYVPVMLMTLGYAAPSNWKRKPRLPLSKVAAFNSDHKFA